jgi:hypothetical protein
VAGRGEPDPGAGGRKILAELREKAAKQEQRQPTEAEAEATKAQTRQNVERLHELERPRRAEMLPETLKLIGAEARWRADLLRAVRGLDPRSRVKLGAGADDSPRRLSEKQKALYNQIPNRDVGRVVVALERTSNLSAVAKETGVDRHDVYKIDGWLNGRGFEAQPGQVLNTTIFVKRR